MLKLLKKKPFNVTYGNRKIYVRKGNKLLHVLKVKDRDMVKMFNEVKLMLSER